MNKCRYHARVVALMCVLATTVAAQAVHKEASVDVPFAFYHNEIMIQVKVNGQGPFTMLLDTNTDPSTIDLETARSLGLNLKQVSGQGSGGGTEKKAIYLTSLKSIDLDGLTAKGIATLALDLKEFGAKLGKPVVGVLGNSFLAGRIVQIDYQKQVLKFFDSSPISNPQTNTRNRVVLPFKYDDDSSSLMIDDASINGKKVRAAIDTGSDGTFKLTPLATKDLGLEEVAAKGEAETSTGYNGAAANRKGTVDKITVASIIAVSPDVIFFGKGTGRDHKLWGLNIGNAFLKDYIVTIDYKKKLISFERP
jgi:predicted aspartyl protease